jgi:hypothetical protein
MDETDFAFRPNDIPWPDFACVSQKIPEPENERI